MNKIWWVLAFILILLGCSNGTIPEQKSVSFNVTYYATGSVSGSVPVDSVNYREGDLVTVADPGENSLAKAGHIFSNWTTNEDGTGESFNPGDSVTMGSSNIYLYAQWTPTAYYTLTYNANGATEGSVPAAVQNNAAGDVLTASDNTGNLLKLNVNNHSHKFTGWNTALDGTGTHYEAGTGAVTFAEADIVLYAEWRPYELRDIGPGGGYIIFNKGTYSDNWRYLEAYPEDLGPHSSAMTNTILFTGISGDIGTGDTNTQIIVNEVGIGDYAARVASDASINGYSDWFLPAISTLEQMYVQLHVIHNLGSFSTTTDYASSTLKYDFSTSLSVNVETKGFDRDGTGTEALTEPLLIRPVRKF